MDLAASCQKKNIAFSFLLANFADVYKYDIPERIKKIRLLIDNIAQNFPSDLFIKTFFFKKKFKKIFNKF